MINTKRKDIKMKTLLKGIKKRLEIGHLNGAYFLTHNEAMMIQSEWLKIFGTGGCDCYPYTTEMDMYQDLLEHYNI
jgi:hypothetical protein